MLQIEENKGHRKNNKDWKNVEVFGCIARRIENLLFSTEIKIIFFSLPNLAVKKRSFTTIRVRQSVISDSSGRLITYIFVINLDMIT